MKLNLTSQIALNKVPVTFYQPATAVDRSEMTRMEKVPTEIFPSSTEGAKYIAAQIGAEIRFARQAERNCVLLGRRHCQRT